MFISYGLIMIVIYIIPLIVIVALTIFPFSKWICFQFEGYGTMEGVTEPMRVVLFSIVQQMVTGLFDEQNR